MKPTTGEMGSIGRVKRDRLLSRDPGLRGSDRPSVPPSEVFLAEAPAPRKEPNPQPTPSAAPDSPKQDAEVSDKLKSAELTSDKVRVLLDLISDQSTTDDW